MAVRVDNLVMHIKLSAHPLNIAHYCSPIPYNAGLVKGLHPPPPQDHSLRPLFWRHHSS